MKSQVLPILLFLFALNLHAQKEALSYDQALKLIEVWLDAQKDFDRLPGISASVVKGQEIMWSGAYGFANREDQLQSSPTTLGSICSISKLFTSVAIMQLYDAGKLRLDDKIDDILPWYDLKQKYPDSGPITIRGVLTHSSGLPREANAPYWTGPDFPFPASNEVRSGLREQETLYPASTYFQYSNLGMTLLGEVVEELSGMPYAAYIQQHILNPLQMTATQTEMPEDQYGDQLAIGYSALDRSGSRSRVKLFQGRGIAPAMGYASNVVELGKFANWQFRLLDTNKVEILKPATLKYMQQVHWTDPDWKTTWGLGFVVRKGSDGSKWVSHGGSCPGYRSTLMLNPSKQWAYSVIVNANGTDPGKYARGMHAILSKVEHVAEGTDSSSITWDDYQGFYDPSPWWSEEYLGILNGQLVSLALPSDEPRLTFFKHIEGDVFRRVRDDKSLGEKLTFIRSSSGEIVGYDQHGNRTRKLRR